MNRKEEKYLKTFIENMTEGVNYYEGLFEDASSKFDDIKHQIHKELQKTESHLNQIRLSIQNLKFGFNN